MLADMPDAPWLDRVAGITQHRANGGRAPHKPLLILLALGSFQRNGTSVLAFTDIEEQLGDLLIECGRPANPEYPFFHLRTDGFWTVTMPDGSEPEPKRGRLREGAVGAFTPAFEEALAASPTLIAQVADLLLEREFPRTQHADLLDAVGLEVAWVEPTLERARSLRRRDPRFRDQVMFAYQRQCAFCGFDGFMSRSSTGLEAAHVRWWAFDGPDDVSNGLCLCSMHHKLFDLGVLTVNDGHRIAVSGHFLGRSPAAERYVHDLDGRPINEPIAGAAPVADEHAEWHRAEVFRAPARSVA